MAFWGSTLTKDNLHFLDSISVTGVTTVTGSGTIRGAKTSDSKNNETISKDGKINAIDTIKPVTPATPVTKSAAQNLGKMLISEMIQKDGKTYVRCKDHMTDADGKERWFCRDDGEWEMHLQRQHGGEAKEVSSANFKAAEGMANIGRSQAEIVLDIFRKLCGPENGEVSEQEVMAELKKTGIEEHEGVKLIASLQRNGQIYERSPGRFSLTIS